LAGRKKFRDEEEHVDRWLVSYADFITLLFAFFVVMYAISSVNEGKYKLVSSSLVSAFKTLPRSLKPIQVGEISRSVNNNVINTPVKKSSSEIQEQNLSKLADKIELEMMPLIESNKVIMRRSKKWLELEMNTKILFNSGHFTIVASAKRDLSKMAKILAPFPNPINVEGFTDNVPIKNNLFPSNWELSAARAASVVHLFSRQGVEPNRMSAIGYGQYRPVADNATLAGRHKNRRVVIAVLAQNLNLRKSKEASNSNNETELIR